MRLFEDPAVDRKFGRMQWRTIIALAIGYSLFYFMRKNFSFAMPGLQQDCGISKSMLGNFLFWGGIVYGLSKFVNGVIGDKMKPKRMFCFGLLVCSLVNVAFGFAPQLAAFFYGGDAPSVTTLAWVFGMLLVMNQFFQGTGFPPCAKLIAFWIPPKELATKMSVWNTSHSIGFISLFSYVGASVAGKVCGNLAQSFGGWRLPLLVMVATAAVGAAVFLCLWRTRANSYEADGVQQEE